MPLAAPRSPNLRSALTRAVLAHLGSGDLLDQAVLAWRPEATEISACPSSNVLAHLSRQRNLYGVTLAAATSDVPDSFVASPEFAKVRTRRALALNPRLGLDSARTLFQQATAARDVPLLIALLKRSPYFAELVSGQPHSLSYLSLRAGQPGPGTLASRLNDVEPFEAETLSQCIFGSRYHRSVLRGSPADVLAAATLRYLDLIASDAILVNLTALASLSEHLLPKVLSPGRRVRLPEGYVASVAALPGTQVISICQVFALKTNPAGPSTANPAKASEFTLNAALAYPPSRDVPALVEAFPHWSVHSQSEVGRWAARQVTDFRQLEALDVLSREWDGNLGDLVSAALTL